MTPAMSPSPMSAMPAPAVPDFLDQFCVPRPVQHASRDLAHGNALRFREPVEVFGNRAIQAHDARLVAGADGDLLHIHVGCVQKAALLGDGQHRQRARQRLRAQADTFERIDGDVDLGAAPAQLLADIEHRHFVLLALANDDAAGNRQVAQFAPHRAGRRYVRLHFVATAAEMRRGHRRGLSNARNVERQRAHERLCAGADCFSISGSQPRAFP